MKITLIPYAGLCNRLNAILSGLAYKKKHPETELAIFWHKWFHCNCRFRDLFKQLPHPYTPVNELVYQIKDIPGHKLNFNIPNLFRGLWYDCTFLDKDKADEFDILTHGKERVYVHHANRFCKEEITHSLSNIFIPTDELQSRIDKITKYWNSKYIIGLHIRRTDNIDAITNSTDEYFYSVIDNEIKLNNNVQFYIASDDSDIKKTLFEKYGNRIITPQLCLNRYSLQGMKDAVIDLYCLGMTRKIYGSVHSTYSTFAARLFNKEIII